jgi:hypothetical protein
MWPDGRMLPTLGLEPQLTSLLLYFIDYIKCGHLITKGPQALWHRHYFTYEKWHLKDRRFLHWKFPLPGVHSTEASPSYPWIQMQVIVRTGRVSRTVQMALRPHGSDKAHGLTHSSDTQAVWEGQSESLVQPISAGTINIIADIHLTSSKIIWQYKSDIKWSL